jgi:hypothetical protein
MESGQLGLTKINITVSEPIVPDAVSMLQILVVLRTYAFCKKSYGVATTFVAK